jgi:hypothetical protein
MTQKLYANVAAARLQNENYAGEYNRSFIPH